MHTSMPLTDVAQRQSCITTDRACFCHALRATVAAAWWACMPFMSTDQYSPSSLGSRPATTKGIDGLHHCWGCVYGCRTPNMNMHARHMNRRWFATTVLPLLHGHHGMFITVSAGKHRVSCTVLSLGAERMCSCPTCTSACAAARYTGVQVWYQERRFRGHVHARYTPAW